VEIAVHSRQNVDTVQRSARWLGNHVCQAFFPRTSAWDNLKRALGSTYEESVWDHLAGTKSAPFEPGEHGQVAVKVIDDRGNELMVVKHLKEAAG
jgi:adenine-specific DNA-methyltransferase